MKYEPSVLGGSQDSTKLLRKESPKSDRLAPVLPVAGMSAAPFIVRIAGLSARALEPFSSPLCLSHLHESRRLEHALAKVRSRLIGFLENELPRHPPAFRRFLLNVKRDCFNGRRLGRLTARPEWQELAPLLGDLVDEALALEQQSEESERDFARIYEQELKRERRHLAGILSEDPFLHGIALGSPDLVDKARIFQHAPDSLGRHEKKVEQSLLRFATRAAAKLSPYSTLTTIGLGTVSREPALDGLRFVAGSSREVSLVRANRTLLDQCQVILLRHPGLRGFCQLALNDTAREIEPGRWSFLRNGHWEIDEERNRFRYVPAVQVRANLSGPLIASIRQLLAGEALLYEVLVDLLQERHDSQRSEICPVLDQLAALGFLSLLPPWRTSELHLERRILEFLHALPWESSLHGLETALASLVRLEAEHLHHPQPEDSARALAAALDHVVEEVDSLSGGEPAQKHGYGLYEDVFVVSSDSPAVEKEVVQLAERTAEEILTHAELISRFACLFNHRHDVLHTLAAVWAERWPSRRVMGVLELFGEIQSLWKDYLRFDVTERYDNFSSFNPLQLASIDRLNLIRAEVRKKTLELMEEHTSGLRLPPSALAALLDTIPQRYRPLLGCSVFVQPAEASFQTWVLNRLFEGSGRYLSRYPAVMEEPMRRRFTAHLAARSLVEVDGEPAELLDLMFTHGTMANLRVPQTRRVLELPGERLDLPPGAGACLGELRIEADLEREQFRLIDGRGRRLLPVHMSSLNNAFLPVVLRFLFVFGPYDVRQVFPRPADDKAVCVRISRRLECGSLVVRRKRWEVLKDEALAAFAGSGADAFRSVRVWWEENDLPQQVYVYEQMHHGSDPVQSFKPQFIDFSSPSLVSLFLSIVRKNPKNSFVEESLPSFRDFPCDPAGQRRALELQIDSLALRANNREPHPGVLRKEK